MRDFITTITVRRIFICAAFVCWVCAPVLGQSSKPDLTETSLESLLNMEVSSASRKQEKFFETSAAIFVISREDIRRSGLTSIPELLRMVPGLQVAHIDANKWAITARGSNGRFANKLLVLIDGRSVYTPWFSGVYWDVQDVLLEDIERIEVIRGPGGTVWGTNATNGVINIITRAAKDTQGGLLSAGAGNQERGFASLRYGARAGSKGHYRVFAKYFDRGRFELPSGQDAQDQWHFGRVGLRADWELSPEDTLTLDAGLYGGRAGVTTTRKYLAQILDSVKGSSILTVADTGGFVRQGGMIGFVLEENRVRLEVNPQLAERSHLRISSKLLALARIVGENGVKSN